MAIDPYLWHTVEELLARPTRAEYFVLGDRLADERDRNQELSTALQGAMKLTAERLNKKLAVDKVNLESNVRAAEDIRQENLQLHELNAQLSANIAGRDATIERLKAQLEEASDRY